MSEDILQGIEDELKPKNTREAMLILAREQRSYHEEVSRRLTSIDGHLVKQNGNVSTNCNRLTKVETIIKIVGAAAALALTAVGAIIAANWSP